MLQVLLRRLLDIELPQFTTRKRHFDGDASSLSKALAIFVKRFSFVVSNLVPALFCGNDNIVLTPLEGDMWKELSAKT